MNKNIEIQFNELQKKINELKTKADALQRSNPENAIVNARKACEAICKHICITSGLIKPNESMYVINLSRMIYLIDENSKAPAHIIEDMRFIQKKGNVAVHSTEKINPEDATPVLYALTNLVNWYFSGTTAKPEPIEATIENQKNFFEKEKVTEQNLVKEKIRKTFENKLFKTAATAVMAATGTAIAAKIFKK